MLKCNTINDSNFNLFTKRIDTLTLYVTDNFEVVDGWLFSECPHPTSIINGTIYYTNTTYNATVTYTCDIGYRLIGNNTNICDDRGTWIGDIPKCQIVGMLYHCYLYLLYHTFLRSNGWYMRH